MKWHYVLAVGLLAQPLVVAGAGAQQAQQAAGQAAAQGQGQQQFDPRRGGQMKAVGDPYAVPAGISTAKTKLGPVHVNAEGKTLYAVNVRMAAGAGGTDASKFCSDATCSAKWTQVSAPANAEAIGYWTVMEGAKGPQWSYKGNPLFTLNSEKAPASLDGNGMDEGMWQASMFVPPVPKVTTPATVAPVFLEGEYVFANKQGQGFFTASKSGDCGKPCAGWTPFVAGLASLGVGEWTVDRDGDQAQWAYRGKRVFVSDAAAPSKAPKDGIALRAEEGTVVKK